MVSKIDFFFYVYKPLQVNNIELLMGQCLIIIALTPTFTAIPHTCNTTTVYICVLNLYLCLHLQACAKGRRCTFFFTYFVHIYLFTLFSPLMFLLSQGGAFLTDLRFMENIPLISPLPPKAAKQQEIMLIHLHPWQDPLENVSSEIRSNKIIVVSGFIRYRGDWGMYSMFLHIPCRKPS